MVEVEQQSTQKNLEQEQQAGQHSKPTQAIMLREALKMILEAKLRPGMTPYKWFKVLFMMHTRGMLYIIPGENNKIKMLIGAYRIPEVDTKYMYVVPEKEEGDNLFVAFSLPKNKKLPISSIKKYLRDNNIKNVVKQNPDDSIREYKLRRKENE